MKVFVFAPGSRMLFRLFVTHKSWKAFHRLRDERRLTYLEDRRLSYEGLPSWTPKQALSPEFIRDKGSWEHGFARLDPPWHPYNDLVGFVELYWDGGTRFMANFYFREPDRRTNWGKKLPAGFHAGKGYQRLLGDFHISSFSRQADEHERREAVREALSEVQSKIAKFGLCVDIDDELALLDSFHMQKLLPNLQPES